MVQKKTTLKDGIAPSWAPNLDYLTVLKAELKENFIEDETVDIRDKEYTYLFYRPFEIILKIKDKYHYSDEQVKSMLEVYEKKFKNSNDSYVSFSWNNVYQEIYDLIHFCKKELMEKYSCTEEQFNEVENYVDLKLWY